MAFPLIKVLSWSPMDPITAEKLNDMVSNDNLLQDNMVRGFYSGASVTKEQGIRVASGLALITANKSASKAKGVTFGNFFSAGCRPIVATGTMSQVQRQIYVTCDGPGAEVLPTRDGFTVNVFVNSTSKKKKISHNFYVSWIALGW